MSGGLDAPIQSVGFTLIWQIQENSWGLAQDNRSELAEQYFC